MKTITIISEDRVGLLADVSYILGKSNINIDSLSVDIIGGRAIVSLCVKDVKRANTVLSRNGFKTAEIDSIVIKIPNSPGEVGKITKRLSMERINIENMCLLSNDAGNGVFALTVDKPRKATRMLDEYLITNLGDDRF